LAMSLLLGCFEPATTAASMAIGKPEAIDDAPGCGPERSGGRRRGEFLASRGMPASPAGEESLTDAIAFQAIEAQPSFGQIKPLRGRVVRVSNSILKRSDMANIERSAQVVRRSRRRKRNPGAQKGRLQRPTTGANGNADGRCLCRPDDGVQPRAFQ
jgi:hypothetical protein